MKKLILLFAAVQCLCITACRHHKNDISFSYTNNDNSFAMEAWFSKNKTTTAELYMNQQIGTSNNISFLNTETDNEFKLDDGSKFYMQKSPGHILIKMNKLENSYEDFYKLQQMCKGLKDVVVK